MNTLDIIIALLVAVPGIIAGLRKGFIGQIVALAGLVIGCYLAYIFSSVVAEWLSGFITASITVLKIISFIIILTLILIALGLLGKLLVHIENTLFGPGVDKFLGILLATVKYFLFGSLLLMVFTSLNSVFDFVPKEELDNSAILNAMKWTYQHVFPFLKGLVTSKF